MSRRRFLRPLVATLALAAAACAAAGPSAYEPLYGRSGYAAKKADDGTWTVEFTGNRFTPRQTVEDYALYRAAEITLEHGYQRFALLDRTFDQHTERTYAYSINPPGFDTAENRYRGTSAYADPFESNRMVSSEWNTARLVIRPYREPPPEGTLRTYDARAEIARLGPIVKRR